MHKSKKITFRCTPDEYACIINKAHDAGLCKSSYCRAASLNSIVRNKKVPVELIRELRALGNNLNQIAKRCNIEKTVDAAVVSSLAYIEAQIIKIGGCYAG